MNVLSKLKSVAQDKFIYILSGCLLLVGFYFWKIVISDHKKRIKELRYNKELEGEKKSNNIKTKIFVGVYIKCKDEIDLLTSFIINLLSSSQYISRVKIGVLYFFNEFLNYKSICESNNFPFYSDNFRSYYSKTPFKGLMDARDIIENNILEFEDIIVYSSINMRYIDGWDSILTDMIDHNEIITTFPNTKIFSDHNNCNLHLYFDNNYEIKVEPGTRLLFNNWQGNIPIFKIESNYNATNKMLNERSISHNFIAFRKTIYPFNDPAKNKWYYSRYIHNNLVKNEPLYLYEFFISNLARYYNIKIKTFGFKYGYLINNYNDYDNMISNENDVDISWKIIFNSLSIIKNKDNLLYYETNKNKFTKYNKIIGIDFYNKEVNLLALLGLDYNLCSEKDIIEKNITELMRNNEFMKEIVIKFNSIDEFENLLNIYKIY